MIETGAPCPVLYPESVSPSVVSDSVTPKTVAQKAPLFMGFSRPEYWSELPFPSPEDLLDPGIEPESAMKAHSLPPELPGNFLQIIKRSNRATPFPRSLCTDGNTLHVH